MMTSLVVECPKHGAFMASVGECPVCGQKAPKTSRKAKASVIKLTDLEKKFLKAWQAYGNGQDLAMQYRVNSRRRKTPTGLWKFYKIDFAVVDIKLAIELQGGTHNNGGHTRGMGYHEDRTRIRDLILMGWTVIEFTTNDTTKANEYAMIMEVLEVIDYLKTP